MTIGRETTGPQRIRNLITTTPRRTRMVQLPATAAIEYIAACWVSGAGGTKTITKTKTKTRTKTKTVRGCLLSGGLMPVPPNFNAYTHRLGFLCLASQREGQKKQKKQTRPPSSAGSRPPLPKFSGYVEVEAHYIFHPSTIWVRPLFTELGPKNPPKSRFCHEANEYMSP